MDKNNIDKNEYPDISGIFDIDESTLPKELMAKEKQKKNRHQKPILISEDKEKQFEKERAKQLKAEEKKQKKKEQKIKKIKKTGIAVLVGILVFLTSVFSLKGFISKKKAPEVILCTAQTGEISVSHLSHALMLLSDTGSLYAAFIDNDFDLHLIKNGLSAIITSADERQFVAHIQAIRAEEPGSEITARIQTMLPDGIYSSASNYVVYVIPTQSITGMNENDIVTVESVIDYASDALLIPSATLFSDENGDFVWKYSSLTHRIKKVYVTAGINNGTHVQIIDGLKKNDSVVCPSDSTVTLSDNQQVKIPQ